MATQSTPNIPGDTNQNLGIYNIEYFSGAQVGVFIGDIFVDEITSMSFSVGQSRTPIFGYASQYFDAVSKGNVMVQGSFTINFKEAGYLWLILNQYRKSLAANPGSLLTAFDPKEGTDTIAYRNIEAIVNDERMGVAARGKLHRELTNSVGLKGIAGTSKRTNELSSGLRGFASTTRGTQGMGLAENAFEKFEDILWDRGTSQDALDSMHRRADDHRLNPFDIFIAYGDFIGDNKLNHTIEKLSHVHITGKSKQIVIDGMPIQEQYTFFARNQV